MKAHSNKFFCFLTFFVCLFGHCFGQNKTTFPDSWDNSRNLRGANDMVLAWTHKTDTTRDFTYKTCILLKLREDSLGNKMHLLEEQYSNDKKFKSWNTAYIHYGPKPGEMLGFYDLHIKSFQTKPTNEEITSLLDSWMYNLKEEGWVTLESGIDEALWMEHFGFVWQDQ